MKLMNTGDDLLINDGVLDFVLHVCALWHIFEKQEY